MCRRIAQGTKWKSCDHFQRQMITTIVDCNSSRCEKSYRHPQKCQDRACIQNFGSDIEEIIDTVDEYCYQCRLRRGDIERV